jgi:hypothetical protein
MPRLSTEDGHSIAAPSFRVYGGRAMLYFEALLDRSQALPRISEFYGVAIYMYYADHAPPHIHVMYGESEASFRIDTLHLLAGSLPARALRMALEWMLNTEWR